MTAYRFSDKFGQSVPSPQGRAFHEGERTMIELDRRHLLAGVAATAATSLISNVPAFAAATPLGTQAPGFYRYKVGSFECTSINDGARSFPMPDGWVKNVPKDKALAAAKAAYMPEGMVTVPFNPQLINAGSKLVLIDCGTGVGSFNATKGQIGRTLQTSKLPVSIQKMWMSFYFHLHPDHTNGIRLTGRRHGFPECRNHGSGEGLGFLD